MQDGQEEMKNGQTITQYFLQKQPKTKLPKWDGNNNYHRNARFILEFFVHNI